MRVQQPEKFKKDECDDVVSFVCETQAQVGAEHVIKLVQEVEVLL